MCVTEMADSRRSSSSMRTPKKSGDSSKKRRSHNESPPMDAFDHVLPSKVSKKECGGKPAALSTSAKAADSSFRPASDFLAPEARRTSPTPASSPSPAPKGTKSLLPSKVPSASATSPPTSGPGSQAASPQAVPANLPPTSTRDPVLPPQVPGAPGLPPQLPGAQGLPPQGVPAPLSHTSQDPGAYGFLPQLPGAQGLPPQGVPAHLSNTPSQVLGASGLPPQGIVTPGNINASSASQGTSNGPILLIPGDYPYAPDHALTVHDRTYRIFLKRSSTGVAPRSCPTLLYAFARVGLGYSMGDFKSALARQGLAVHHPEARKTATGAGDSFGSLVARYFPGDYNDIMAKGAPEAMITGELFTFGDLVRRLFDLSILDPNNSVELNLHREKYDGTRVPSSATRNLFPLHSERSEGVVASSVRVDQDLDLGSNFSGEEEGDVAEVVDNGQDEMDELRRVTYEQGLNEEEEEIAPEVATVTRAQFNEMVRKYNSQTRVVNRLFQKNDVLTLRLDNYVKGDMKMTNQQMATVVKAALDPLVKRMDSVQGGLQVVRAESSAAAGTFYKKVINRQEDIFGLIIANGKAVKALAPAPRLGQVGPPPFPYNFPLPGQGFQGPVSHNQSFPPPAAPAVQFAGPPPMVQTPFIGNGIYQQQPQQVQQGLGGNAGYLPQQLQQPRNHQQLQQGPGVGQFF